jgi:hypothetical protein
MEGRLGPRDSPRPRISRRAEGGGFRVPQPAHEAVGRRLFERATTAIAVGKVLLDHGSDRRVETALTERLQFVRARVAGSDVEHGADLLLKRYEPKRAILSRKKESSWVVARRRGVDSVMSVRQGCRMAAQLSVSSGGDRSGTPLPRLGGEGWG